MIMPVAYGEKEMHTYEEMKKMYEAIGYQVFLISVEKKEGLFCTISEAHFRLFLKSRGKDFIQCFSVCSFVFDCKR
jgi:hypothetical protein